MIKQAVISLRSVVRGSGFYKHVTAGCSLAALALPVNAELYTEQDFLSDIPDVISATRMSQKLTQAPAAITIIDRETIDAAPVFRVADLFRLVPGMQALTVSKNKYAVTYHGVSDNFPNRLEVMVDGRSIYLPSLSTVDWSSLGLTLEDIDHIEVVRGSNVPAYGSNAFLGAINIVTRSALTEQGSSVKALAGAQDYEQLELRHADFNESINYRVSAGYRGHDGGEIFNDAEQTRYLNLSLALAPTLNDTVDLQFGLTDGYTYVGDADKADNVFTRRDNRSNYQYLRWNRVLTADEDLQVTLYRNELETNVPLLPIEQLLVQEFDQIPDLATARLFAQSQQLDGVFARADSEHGQATTADAELQYTRLLSDKVGMVLVGGYRKEAVLSDTALDSTSRITEERLRLFGNVQWQQDENLTWNLGAMVEHFSGNNATRLSPRAALNYRLTDRSAIRTAYTRAYRMPSLLDSNMQTVVRTNTGEPWEIVNLANGDLDPEQLDSVEVGYYQQFDRWDSEVDVRVFHEQVEDGIRVQFEQTDLTDQNGFFGRNENAMNWDSYGVEFQLKSRPWSGALWIFNYGYQHVDGLLDKGVKRANDLELHILDDGAPMHTASALLSQKFESGWQLSLASYYMDEVEWLEGGKRDAFWRSDLKLARSWSLDNQWKLESALIVQDLFNESYSEFYAFNEVDRSVYFQLMLSQ